MKKICKTCGENKELTEFYSNGSTPAGTPKYKAHCKPCLNNNRKSNKTARVISVLAEQNRVLACELCGYNKNSAALCFHHLDEAEKDFSISEVSTIAAARLKIEIEKCAILCHNCHMEVHYPHLEIVVDDQQLS